MTFYDKIMAEVKTERTKFREIAAETFPHAETVKYLYNVDEILRITVGDVMTLETNSTMAATDCYEKHCTEQKQKSEKFVPSIK